MQFAKTVQSMSHQSLVHMTSCLQLFFLHCCSFQHCKLNGESISSNKMRGENTEIRSNLFLTKSLPIHSFILCLACLPPCWFLCCFQIQLEEFKQPGVRLGSEGWLLHTLVFLSPRVLTGPGCQGSPVTHGGIMTPRYSSPCCLAAMLCCHGNKKTERLSWCWENYT